MKKGVLGLILLLAIFFRFNNLNWDSNYHLHPDERFLTMVGGAMKIPQSFSDYFNPSISTMNPSNIGFDFYVYGLFPVTLNKIVAVIYNNDNYNALTIQGRFLSAFFDIFTLIIVFKTVELIERRYKLDRSIKYWSAFFYAISVLPIQLSHFFAVDTFLTFFMTSSFYFALRAYFQQERKSIAVSAVLFGLATASKISAIFIFPLIMFFVLSVDKTVRSQSFVKNIKNKLINLSVFFSISYLVLRIADPYIFKSGNIFDFRISDVFINNLKALKSFEGRDVWYPPAIQWINKKPVIYSLYNLAVFGVGLPYFGLILVGIINIVKILTIRTQLSRARQDIRLTLGVILLWIIGFFLYQSTQFVKAMRYFIFIYPFLAIMAGYGAYNVINLIKSKIQNPKQISNLELGLVISNLIIIITVLIWPLSFSSIYLNKHSRVEASEWIYKNLENDSFILAEHWDDALPLSVETNYGKTFQIEYLPVFAPDDETKWQTMNNLLQKADYYILSSNRGWGSIPTAPEKYPKMTQFYKDLLANNLRYKLVKQFTSYPRLCIPFSIKCLEFRDDYSDESFTVYDHPKVLIFQKK